MNDEPARRLSEDEITALRFAAQRQLTRWAQKGRLSSPHAQRPALARAARILADHALADGCELRPTREQ